MRERLQKVLAAAGVASRRHAEDLIRAGDVTVNGASAHLGQVVNRELDVIAVRGQPILLPGARTYVALNKPKGLVTSMRSTHGEATVMDLIESDARLFPVGRLDKETTGLLLLTDDGDWANLVTHPRHALEKEYDLLVRGRVGRTALEHLSRGVRLPDGSMTAPARVEIRGVRSHDTQLSVTVIEGKKRQIRLMTETVGHPVLTLSRVRVGPIALAGLPEGHWRHLTTAEVEAVRTHGRHAPARSRAPGKDADRD